MKQQESRCNGKSEDGPLPLRVAIVYNLKREGEHKTQDAQAEYDHIDTVYAIRDAIESSQIQVFLIEEDRDMMWNLEHNHIDFVFNIAEGVGGRSREGQVPAILDFMNIPYTGSDCTSLCMALDKNLTKKLLSGYGIASPKTVVIGEKLLPWRRFKYPLIVKPNAEGSSKGISDLSIVASKQELDLLSAKYRENYDSDILVEEYIDGREFTIGICGNGEQAQVFEPMEIVFKKPTQDQFCVYSYPVKQDYTQFVSYSCPAKLSKKITMKMKEMALKIYQVLECKDFSRVDFRMDKNGTIYFIEINPLPGLAPNYSDYPMIAEKCGIGYKELVRTVFLSAVHRYHLQLVYDDMDPINSWKDEIKTQKNRKDFYGYNLTKGKVRTII